MKKVAATLLALLATTACSKDKNTESAGVSDSKSSSAAKTASADAKPASAAASGEAAASTKAAASGEADAKGADGLNSNDDGKRVVIKQCVMTSIAKEHVEKVAAAKNMLGWMRRGLQAAYQRETREGPPDDVCKTAIPVPPDGPPKGTTYQPKKADFEKGDDATGWKCARIDTSEPTHFQYGFSAGSGYKSLAYGLPDPGADGIEVWASADFDGDGKTSLFVRVGQVDRKAHTIKWDEDDTCVDPSE